MTRVTPVGRGMRGAERENCRRGNHVLEVGVSGDDERRHSVEKHHPGSCYGLPCVYHAMSTLKDDASGCLDQRAFIDLLTPWVLATGSGSFESAKKRMEGGMGDFLDDGVVRDTAHIQYESGCESVDPEEPGCEASEQFEQVFSCV